MIGIAEASMIWMFIEFKPFHIEGDPECLCHTGNNKFIAKYEGRIGCRAWSNSGGI